MMDVSKIITIINSKLAWTKFINELEERGFKKHKGLGYFLENQSNLGDTMLLNNVIMPHFFNKNNKIISFLAKM